MNRARKWMSVSYSSRWACNNIGLHSALLCSLYTPYRRAEDWTCPSVTGESVPSHWTGRTWTSWWTAKSTILRNGLIIHLTSYRGLNKHRSTEVKENISFWFSGRLVASDVLLLLTWNRKLMFRSNWDECTQSKQSTHNLFCCYFFITKHFIFYLVYILRRNFRNLDGRIVFSS